MTGFYIARSGYVGDVTEQWYRPSQEATYIIGQYNSTHYYMQNHTGFGYEAYDGYEYMSTNASAVINNAIGNLPVYDPFTRTGGGKVSTRDGTYNLDTRIVLKDRLIFEGEGDATLFQCNAWAYMTMFGYGQSTIISNVVLRDFKIAASLGPIPAIGIDFYNVTYSTIDHVSFSDSYHTADVRFYTAAWTNKITNCYLENWATYPLILLDSDAPLTWLPNFITIQSNILGMWGNGIGIDVERGTEHIIDGNDIEQTASATGIYLNNSITARITKNYFEALSVGVNVSSFSTAYIKLNSFSAVTTPIGNNGTVYAKDNAGFVTENSVSATNSTATTFVVNHGLAAAAMYVWCSFNSTWTDKDYTWTSTATQITVTITGTPPDAVVTCYCRCEYAP